MTGVATKLTPIAATDPARTRPRSPRAAFDPPRKPGGTGRERTAAAPLVCPECNAPILGPGHVCKPRLDAVSAAWLARYRRTARRLPHLDAEQLGARVEQHLTGVAA